MIAIALLLSIGQADVEPPAFFAGNDELRGYLLEAADRNPGLRATYEEWKADVERTAQAGVLEDPMLTYGQFVQSEMNRFKLMFEQKFPWFGTLRAQRDKAAAEADAALAKFYDERNRLFADVKRAYFEYAYLGESLRATEAQADVLLYMEDVARSKLSLGMSNQDDLLRVSIEKTQLDDRYKTLEASRGPLAAVLNETLGCEVCREQPWPATAAFPPEPPPAPVVLARMRTTNPGLRTFDCLQESRKKDIELARKSGYPQIGLGVEYMSISKPRQMRPDRVSAGTLSAANGLGKMIAGSMPFQFSDASIMLYELGTAREPMNYSDGGEDDIAISLSATLPIWRKRVRAGIEEAELMESATVHAKRRRALALDSAARMALFSVEDAQRRHALYTEQLLPQARQTYESLQSGYAVDLGAGFLDVMESVRRLLDFELERARAAHDWQLGAAELEYLIGGPWATEPTRQAEDLPPEAP